MPYDPNPITERERSGAFITIWIGLAASLLTVGGTLYPISVRLPAASAWILGLWLLIVVFSRRFDSYFTSLRDFGAVVAVAILALWLALNGLLVNSDGSPEIVRDPWLLTGLAATGFHAGFLFAHLKGGR